MKDSKKVKIDVQERETSGPRELIKSGSRAAEHDNESVEDENGADHKKLYVKWYVRNERTGRPN